MWKHQLLIFNEGWSDELWYSCPSCWEYTEISPCMYCWIIIDDSWQAIWYEMDRNSIEEPKWIVEATQEKTKQVIQSREIVVNGINYIFYWAKTEKDRLVFFLKWGVIDIKVVCNPNAEKSIIWIYMKGKYKRIMLSNNQFQALRTIISLFKNNPEKYGLSQLKIFQH